MSSNKRTSKVKNGILFAVVIAFLIAIIGGTYARYSSSGRVDSAGEIAKWNIKLGNQDISSETKTIDVNLTPDEESNTNTTLGKLAPGQKLSGTFKVDPTGSEVAVDYLLTIGSVQATSGTWNAGSELSLSKVTALLEDETEATELTIAEGGTTYFENLTDVLNGKDVTFKIYVTWENSNDANNDADTENGASVTQITIPVTVVIRQHIGDDTPLASTSYTVTFKDGETTLSTATVEKGQTVTKPTDPTKEDYDFVDWYSDSELTNLFDFTNTITGNITIYAKWEETASTSARSLISPKPTGTTYEAGDEVTFKGENFFVISDNGTKVILLAKYCLLRDASAQTDKEATYDGTGTAGYGRTFSSTNYWNGKSGISYTNNVCELQTTERLALIPSTDTVANNAILAAQKYGTDRGVAGRLMTKDEADSMQSSNSAIMYGTWTDGTQPTQEYLYWWLGDAYNTDYVWYVRGKKSKLDYQDCSNTNRGVRPVLEIE